jgi:hypothetical protein
LERATDIVNNVNKKAKGTKLKDFKDTLQEELGNSDIVNLKKDINEFVKEFPVPGGNI